MREWINDYSAAFIKLVSNVDYQDVSYLADQIISAHRKNQDIFAIANGGSFAITSHLITDLNKACGIRGVNFSDPSLLTCFSNDYGYDSAYEKLLRLHGDGGGLLIAISSSGESKNIVNAVNAGIDIGLNTISLTGFGEQNAVRKASDFSIYVHSSHYNHVEMTHQFIILQAIDLVRQKLGRG